MQALPLPHRRKISVTTFVGNANAILPQRRRECTPRGMQLGACNYILLASVWYPCYGVQEQPLQNTRQNELPMKLIDGSLVMRHEYVAGAPVELMQIRQTASSADGVLHHPPEPFNGIEVVPTMGR